MLSTILLPWLHYLAVLMMAGGAVAELYLLKLASNAATVRLLPRVDRVYGIMAGLVLVTGLARVYHGGKGPDYYWHNGMFHGVLTLFIVTALISIAPTLRFMRWRKAVDLGGALPTDSDVRKTRMLVHIQLAAIAGIALLITMTARGFGGGH
jgi:putative membrane protein